MSYVKNYLEETKECIDGLNLDMVEELIGALQVVRDRHGRVFVLGMGGSAANASHLVNDLRKMCEIQAYSPSDNLAEFSARVNDEGLDFFFTHWLRVSRLNKHDLVLFMSGSGGGFDTSQSFCLIKAMRYAKEHGAWTAAIVGKQGSFLHQEADIPILIPMPTRERLHAHAEEMQGVIWHLCVNDPRLMKK